MALFQSGTSHCGNLLNWHLILFRIIKNDFIVVALDQWELRRQGWGQGGRIVGGYIKGFRP